MKRLGSSSIRSAQWALLRQMTHHEIVGRYRGSMIGLAWSLATPVLMLSIYTFVFSVVFGARWGGFGNETPVGFAIVLFVGMIVHGIVAESLTRAPALVVANPNYVKRVVFPLEVLPVVSMAGVLFHAIVSLIVWIVAAWIVLPALPWTILLAPLVIVPLAVGTLGVSWFFASLGVFLRDMNHFVGLLSVALLFASPVFYPVEALPEAMRPYFLLNPLAFAIEQLRAVMIWGEVPAWGGLALFWSGALALAAAGLWWFRRTKRAFADVL
jgi:lipopolysaccharide transport system permease protein